ncbi:hypothetical protein PIROE2DRAFT_15868 [Piromyces sp. E2]|nr:hypothetical protein PIROE2DRAFT_15868 [Piromyces sp. E2]|eukprot:OUM58786.1 hypothetical protein PIROE2DRAFT_15868 [Piromyces sp. E2]
MKEEIFEYLEVLIDDKYPFYSKLNVAVTPFDNIKGKECLDKEITNTKKELCNSILEQNGTYPYYYYYNNNINTVYLTHISSNSDRGIFVNTNSTLNSSIINKLIFKNDIYICDNKENYNNNTITYKNKYNIIFPLNNNESILLKSMEDIKTQKIDNCLIFDNAIKKAKPMQFPYNTSEFEIQSSISLLFAHLYYKHNTTNEGSFEDIINECCDLIDYSFLPNCKNHNNIKYIINKCDNKNQTVEIKYLNCKDPDKIDFPTTTECNFIPSLNIKGITVSLFTTFSLTIEIFFTAVIIICSSGNDFLITAIFAIDYILLIISNIMSFKGRNSNY